MEAWGGLHNTEVAVRGCTCVMGEGEGELRTRGIAVCVQNPCTACPDN